MSGYESPTPEDEQVDPERPVPTDPTSNDPIAVDPAEAPPLREGAPVNNGQTRENLRLS